MIQLATPWALVLLVPALAAWWWWGRQGAGAAVRLAAVLALGLAMARPSWHGGSGGSDVVVVLDRSASMGAALDDHPVQLAAVAGQRGRHDRLAVVVAGDGARIAAPPAGSAPPPAGEALAIGPDGSDLAAGIDAAAALLAPGRSGRVVLISDGESTGPDPLAAAARLAGRGIPVDVLPVARPTAPDAAIREVEMPGAIRLGESFLGAIVVVGDRAETRRWEVQRDGKTIASGTVDIVPGRAVAATFADRPSTPGLVRYRCTVDAAGDRQPLNNAYDAALRVDPGERVLVVGGDGRPGNVSAALSAAGMAVATRPTGPIALADLLGCSVLVLDEVPAGRLGRGSMQDIAHWVERLGGGLVVGGGKASLGSGGYHKSPLDPVLPVSLEIRDEHRKSTLAMAIALDRSGSMAAPAGDGRTKMDLADEGAAAAVELLGPKDHLAVFAVDSAPHEIVPFGEVGARRAAIVRDILAIGSEGGGIYVGAALLECGKALAGARSGTRHIVLFADAADAEEPGDYRSYLRDMTAAGITVSVVAMGSERDSDAALLTEIAELGGGRISFAEQPQDIPRLFAQETILVARSSWIDTPAAMAPRPAATALLGGGMPAAWPTAAGWNLCHLRDRAQALATFDGDPAGPAVAAWTLGAGRVATVCFDLDGGDAAITSWSGYGRLVAGVARWASGGQDRPGAIAAQRRGRTLELALDLDPRAVDPSRPPTATLTLAGDAAHPTSTINATLARIDAARWSGSVDLPDGRIGVAAARIGDAVLVAAPQMVPMSPEAAPRHGLPPGSRLLADLARAGGGSVRSDLAGCFANPPSPGRIIDLAPWLALTAVLLLLAENAARRLRLGFAMPRLRLPRRSPPEAPAAPAAVAEPEAPPAPGQPSAGISDALSDLKRRRSR